MIQKLGKRRNIQKAGFHLPYSNELTERPPLPSPYSTNLEASEQVWNWEVRMLPVEKWKGLHVPRALSLVRSNARTRQALAEEGIPREWSEMHVHVFCQWGVIFSRSLAPAAPWLQQSLGSVTG